jgi:capsular polysaccharide biosynthesis protein
MIRRRLAVVVVTVLVGLAVGYLTTSTASRYSTTAEIYVGSRQLTSDPLQLYGLAGFDQVVQTFATMIRSPSFAEAAIQNSDVPRSVGEALGETQATVLTNTNLITVTVTDSDPLYAQDLANGISNAFVRQIAAYEPGSTPTQGSVPVEPAYVFQEAGLPGAPLADHLVKKVVLGGLFGLVIAVLLVLLLDYVDVTVKSPAELEKILDLPVLGVVPLRRSLGAIPVEGLGVV